MSLIFYDGFNNYTFLPLKWEECTKDCQFSIKDNIGRKGDKALCAFSGTTYIPYEFLGKILPSPLDTFIIGFAFKKVKVDYGFIEVDFNFEETTQSKLKLFDSSIVWYKGNEAISYGVNYSLKSIAWNYIEAKINTHTTSGTVDLRVNERTILTLSGISTATTTNYIDRVRFKLRHITQTNEDYAYIDDIYITNVSGTVNNTFLGNCTSSSIVPSSQGTYSDFYLPSTVSGVSNYSMVNEAVYQQDTTTYSGTFPVMYSGDDGGFQDTAFYSNVTTTSFLQLVTSVPMGLFFKFSGLNIPKNAKILTAKLQVYTVARYTTTSYRLNFEMAFQKISTPPNTISSISDFNSRTITNAKKTTQLYNEDPTTINNKDSLQELVDNVNWLEENNSVLLKFYKTSSIDTGSASSERYNIRQYDYTNDPYSESTPRLYVEWQLPTDPLGTYIKAEDINKKDSYSFTVSGISNIFAIKYDMVAKRFLDRARTDDLALIPIVTDGATTYNEGKVNFKDINYINKYVISEKNPFSDLAWELEDLQSYEFGILTTTSG